MCGRYSWKATHGKKFKKLVKEPENPPPQVTIEHLASITLRFPRLHILCNGKTGIGVIRDLKPLLPIFSDQCSIRDRA